MALTTPAGFPTSAVGTGQATLSVTPVNVGDLLIFTAFETSVTTTTITSIAGGGVTTWVKDLQAVVGAYSLEIWHGVVTATGAATITPTWSASISADGIEYTCTAVNSGLGLQTRWRTVASGSLHNTGSTTVTFPSLKTDEGALQVYYGAGIVPVNCSDGSFAGYTFFKDVNGNPSERGLNLAPNTAQQPTCVNSGTNVSDTIAGLYAAFVQGFPYNAVLPTRVTPLSLPILGPPLFAAKTTTTVTGSIAGTLDSFTGAAAGSATSPQLPQIQAVLLNAPPKIGLSFPSVYRLFKTVPVTGTSAQTLGTFTSTAQGSATQPQLPHIQAVLLNAPPATTIELPTLGPPLFATQPVTGNVGQTLGSFTSNAQGSVPQPTLPQLQLLLLEPYPPGIHGPIIGPALFTPYRPITGTSTQTLGSFTGTAQGSATAPRLPQLQAVLLYPAVTGIELPLVGPSLFVARATTVTGTSAQTLGTFTSSASGSTTAPQLPQIQVLLLEPVPPGVQGPILGPAFFTSNRPVAGTTAQTLGAFTGNGQGTFGSVVTDAGGQIWDLPQHRRPSRRRHRVDHPRSWHVYLSGEAKLIYPDDLKKLVHRGGSPRLAHHQTCRVERGARIRCELRTDRLARARLRRHARTVSVRERINEEDLMISLLLHSPRAG